MQTIFFTDLHICTVTVDQNDKRQKMVEVAVNCNLKLGAKISAQLDHSKMHNQLCAKQLHLKYIPGAPVFRKCWNTTGCLKKNFLLSKMPWQILLLAVRNPYETLANTSKTPSPSFTASKFVSLSTCDDLSSKAAIQSASAILSCNGVSQEVVVNDTQSDSIQYLNFAKK